MASDGTGTLQEPYRRVSCDDYLAFLEPKARGFEAGPDEGQYGPRHALPALAVVSRIGNPVLAQGIKRTLRHYGEWVDREIAERGGVQSMEGATLLAIHFRELRKRGQVGIQDEQWLRDMLLKLRRYSYGLKPGDGPWRGSQHRGAVDATNNLLAGSLYSNAPKAAQWRAAGERGWNDWWAYRDVGINDIAYFSDSLAIFLRTADVLHRREVFTDPRVRANVWDRLLFETSPDGALIPYGSHAGWDGLAGVRIWALELAARETGDGRYRFAAGQLMNYALAHGGFSPGQEHWAGQSIEAIAMAAIACDDAVEPVRPEAGSRILERPEIVRLDLPQVRALYPGAGDLDARMAMTNRQMPSKLILRSGWNQGDMFMLVEAFARHDPLNPTAILGFERWGSSFAEAISEKEVSRENAVRIDPIQRAVPIAGVTQAGPPDHRRLPTGYDRMDTRARIVRDDPLVTHAEISVGNYMGFRATQTREFLFVKNRLVLVRDETAFAEGMTARVGPVWNTQDIGRQRGSNWVDTSFSGHWYNAKLRLYGNPPGNLLLYYSPRPKTLLRTVPADSSGYAPDSQQAALQHFQEIQYAWDGAVQPGARLQFVSILLPHSPRLQAAPLARAIHVLRDEPGLAVVTLGGPQAWELVLLNKEGRRLTFDSPRGPVTTDAKALYLALGDGAPRWSATGATVVEVGGKGLFTSSTRGSAGSEA
ncbi:hypothetical protein ACFO0A_02915 [Novosphingobium tardum]|uniref:Heparin-sulfate lyase N-terminal domain-containing protein n=1 Tax=Novosphingobium tardum TaxID=1538021 RepID=A0ABV8RM37_9SPHN